MTLLAWWEHKHRSSQAASMLFKAEVFHEILNQLTLLYTFVWINEFSISAYLISSQPVGFRWNYCKHYMIYTCVFTGSDPRPSTVDHIVVTKGWGMSGLLSAGQYWHQFLCNSGVRRSKRTRCPGSLTVPQEAVNGSPICISALVRSTSVLPISSSAGVYLLPNGSFLFLHHHMLPTVGLCLGQDYHQLDDATTPEHYIPHI